MPQPFLMTATTEIEEEDTELSFGLLFFGPSCT